MGRVKVKLNFMSFWSRMTPEIFFKSMPEIFDLYEFTESPQPDFIIYSTYSPQPIPKDRVRIFYAAERTRPNMNTCNWAFTFYHENEIGNPRHMRFPNYKRAGCGKDLLTKQRNTGKKFCAFVYANPNVAWRNEIFKRLSQYKHVDAPGSVFKNMPGISVLQNQKHSGPDRFHREKIEFLADYKFTIAYENAQVPGYTTEKIYHPMAAGSLPIYRGNPMVHLDFNPASFVNFHDYNDTEAMVKRIIELDKNDDLYNEVMKRPWYPGNKLTPWVDNNRYIKRFREIFENVRSK